MLKRIPILIALFGAITSIFAQLPREVWFDPTSSALATNGVSGSQSNPLGGAGGAFDANMYYLTIGPNGAPTYPNLVIHLKAGTYETFGHYHTNYVNGHERSWALRKGQRLVGEGIDRTIIRRINESRDFYYVLASAAGEANVEVQDLTIDANYWASTDPNISAGGLNMWHLGRVRGVKITGTSGNTDTPQETFSLRMSGWTAAGVADPTATGGLIENCEISNVKNGYISAILIGAGQSMVVNNRIYLPHYTTPAVGDNQKGAHGINVASTVNTIISGNYIAGGFGGLYSDSGVVSNLTINANQFHDNVVGIQILRKYDADVDTVHITDNIIHMSSDNTVSYNRYGIWMRKQDEHDGTISNVKIDGNIIKGGKFPLSTGLHFERLGFVICYNNRLDEVFGRPLQTSFDISGGLIYNLYDDAGDPVAVTSWLSPYASDWLARTTIPSNAPSSSYAIKVGDNYIGLQKSGYTITLPDAMDYLGKEIIVVNETGNTLTGSILNCSVAGQTINGSVSLSLAAPYTSIRVTSNGTNWIRF